MSQPIPSTNDAVTKYVEASDWRESTGYRLHLLIVKEAEASFSVAVLNLPGTGSCGESEERAIENAKDAVREAIEVYEADGEGVPWVDSSSDEIPAGATHKWIVLDA